MFQFTTAIRKLRRMQKRKRVVQGGTSAGKTVGIIAVLIDWCIKNPDKRVTVVAETIPAVKQGALRIFKNTMHQTGRWNENRWHDTDRMYTFGNGTTIQFTAFDTIGKAQQADKRDVLFINEAPYIEYEIADALITRSAEVWLDFNPTFEFWAHTEILTEHDAEFLLLKYTDNEALPATTLEELHIKLSKAYHDPNGDRSDPGNIKNEYWHNWCRVYIDGEVGNLEGVVFSNWKQLDNIPSDAVLESIGVDFGFTNSFTAITERWRWKGKKIFSEVAYARRMKNGEIADKLKQYTGMVPIIADSEDPRTIDDICDYGIDMTKALKGADSVQFSIEKLQEDEFFVTSHSRNIIKELRGYIWEKDAAGRPTNKPVKKNDHAVDSIRYTELGEEPDEIEYHVG